MKSPRLYGGAATLHHKGGNWVSDDNVASVNLANQDVRFFRAITANNMGCCTNI